MPPETILELVQARPFVPFKICVTDGKEYEVRHPEMVMTGKRTVTIGIPGESGKPLYERTITVSLLHVIRIEPFDQVVNPGNN